MNRTWLIIDSNYLCHRAKHSMKGLAHEGAATGVIFGFLKEITYLMDHFQTKYICFCWDLGKGLREDVCSTYKADRKERDMSEEDIAFEVEFSFQMAKLREEYLYQIGFRNVYAQSGYESDDLMASIAYNLPKGDSAIMVTADQDMYQCIRPSPCPVSMYSPAKKEVMTFEKFTEEYGIIPGIWVHVKALAGCTSDNVKGIQGVGNKTAIKYLRGELKQTTKAFKNIKEQSKDMYNKNLPLVKLPYIGTNTFKLKKDKPNPEGWMGVMKLLGMESLKEKSPWGRIRKKKDGKGTRKGFGIRA